MTALKRIRKLFEMAKESSRSRRYVGLAKKISTRTRTHIPKDFKQQVCKGCGALLVPGKGATVRTGKNRRKITCHECGKTRVFPMKPRQ